MLDLGLLLPYVQVFLLQAAAQPAAQATVTNTDLQNLVSTINNIGRVGIALVIPYGAVMGIRTAFQYMHTGGDPIKVAHANTSLFFTLLGVVLGLLAFLVTRLLASQIVGG